MNIVSRLMILPIRLYQRVSHPFLPRACRYHPSCSEYFIQALEQKGPVKGALLGVWRILRCHPFAPGGYDPVKRD